MRAREDFSQSQSNMTSTPDDESRDHYQQLVEYFPDAIGVICEEKLVFINQAGIKSIGATKPEDIIGKSVFDFMHVDYHTPLRARLRQVTEEKKIFPMIEERVHWTDGSILYIEVASMPIVYRGKPAVQFAFRDITERKRSEKLQDAVYRIAQAADQSRRLEDLFPAVHAIISEVMTANNFYIALYDDEKDLLSFPYFVDEFDTPSPPSKPGRGLTELVLRTGKSYLVREEVHDELERSGEVELIGAQSPVWLGVPLIINEKVIGAMVVQHYSNPLAYGERERRMLEFVSSQVAMAINRKRSEEALRESEERFRSLFENSTIGLYRTSAEGVILLANPTLVRMLGYRSFKELSKRQLDNNEPGFVTPRRQFLELIEAKGVLLGYEADWRRKNGSIIHVRESAKAIRDVDGKILYYEGTVEDITKRKNAEEALRKKASEFAALYETTRDLASQYDLSSLLGTIVERATSLIGSSGGSIYLYDEESEELEVVVAKGLESLVGSRLKRGEGMAGRVAKTLKPILVDDYRTWKSHSKKLASLSITSVAEVPMLYGGLLIGVLSVYELADEAEMSSVHRRFTQSDVDLLTFFAGAAASAVHNARLFEETRQRLVELEVLCQASLASTQIYSPRAVGERIIAALEKLLSWQNGSIWVIDEKKKHPALIAHSIKGQITNIAQIIDEFLDSSSTRKDHGVIGWVCISGQTIRSGNVKTLPQYINVIPGMQSEMCVPLKVGGRTIGCINVESPKPDAFSEHDERLLATLAGQAAIAIENARLFEETRQRAAQQSAIIKIIGEATHAALDLESFLDAALEQTLGALELNMGAVWLAPSTQGPHRVAARGIENSVGMVTAKMAAITGIDLLHTIVADDWTEEKDEFGSVFQSMGVRASITVPMLVNQKRIGGLSVASAYPRHWTVEEIELVETVGREVGAAAERARLFEVTNLRLQELEAVYHISTDLRAAQSLDEMLPHLLKDVVNVLHVGDGSIWLCDSQSSQLFQISGCGWNEAMSDVTLNLEDGVPGKVYTSGDVYFSHELASDSNLNWPAEVEIPIGWGGVGVPIRAEAEIIGAFFIAAKLPREFSQDEVQLLITVSEIAGNAIHRTRLHEQTIRHAEELETRVTERTGELQLALQQAQAADRLKSEFVANVNHELRTPLTNLLLYHQMLRAQPHEKTEERLDVIGREMQRLRVLIEDLLNLSRFDLGQVSFSPLPHDLNDLIETLIKDRRSLAEERGLQLHLRLSKNLPTVWFDDQLIAQAVSNLLTNALNYTPSGGIVIVRTMHRGKGSMQTVGFSVQDSGPGIDDEDFSHLFERFFRGKVGHNSGAPGTGLGLAIVKQVVERHKGSIEVDSGKKTKRGASFTVWLPVQGIEELNR